MIRRMGMVTLFTRSMPLRTPKDKSPMLQAKVIKKNRMAAGMGPTLVFSMM